MPQAFYKMATDWTSVNLLILLQFVLVSIEVEYLGAAPRFQCGPGHVT